MVTTVREDVTAPAVYSIIGGREVMISPPRTVRGGTQTLKQRKQSEEAQRQAEAQRLAERQAEAQRVAQVEAQRVAQAQAQQQAEAQRAAERQQLIVQATAERRQLPGTTAIIDYGRQVPPTTIYAQPTVVQRQIGVTREPKTGQKIPVEGTFFIEPSEGMGLVTLKETQIFPTSKEELISPDVYSIVGRKPVIIEPSKVVSRIERFNIEGYEPFEITEEPKGIPLTTTEKLFSKVGLLTPYQKIRSGTYKAETKITSIIRGKFTEEESAKQRQNIIESREFLIAQSKQSTQSLINIGVPSFIAKVGGGISRAGIETGSLIAGGSGYIAERTIEKPITFPLKFVAIGAATVGLGYGVSALPVGVGKGVGAIAGYKAGVIAGTTIKVGAVGAGVYFGGKYAIETTEKIIAAPSVFERGGILAESGFTVAAGVAGFRTGAKLWTQTRGWYATRGREYIDIPKGEYPTASISKHLKMFQENVYKELGAKAGAFRTESQIFWEKGKIVPAIGKYELPGTYAGTKISTPFARISVSGKTKLLPTTWQEIKLLFDPQLGKPGVAFLQPKGFRYSPAIKEPIIIEGYKFPYSWVRPPRAGYADVPGIKREIETIFRPGTGTYILESQKFYTTISGVRIPIDVFKYEGIVTAAPTPTLPELFKAGYYSGVPYFSVVSPEAGVSFILTPSKTITPSTTVTTFSITPSVSSIVSIPPSYPSIPSTIPSISPSGKSYALIPPSIISPVTLPYYPPISPSIPTIPKSYLPYIPKKVSYIPTPPRTQIISKGKPLMLKYPFGKFQVLGRRFGKFKLIGIGTEKKAFTLGKGWARKTLGATFKVPGTKARKLIGFKTKITDEGILYIEPKKKRLKKGTLEIPEIQYFRKLKGGKK